jgi:hypothetical protein
MKTEGHLSWYQSIHYYTLLAGKCRFPGPNGLPHESSINVFSVFSTF